MSDDEHERRVDFMMRRCYLLPSQRYVAEEAVRREDAGWSVERVNRFVEEWIEKYKDRAFERTAHAERR